MAATLELRAAPIRSIVSGSILVGYSPIGTALERPMRIINVQNTTNALLMFSFEGGIDHFALPANSFLLIDVTANDISLSGFFISKGTLLQVKQIGVPTTGTVYVSTYFARGS